jgi:hypothetical protein
VHGMELPAGVSSNELQLPEHSPLLPGYEQHARLYRSIPGTVLYSIEITFYKSGTINISFFNV